MHKTIPNLDKGIGLPDFFPPAVEDSPLLGGKNVELVFRERSEPLEICLRFGCKL